MTFFETLEKAAYTGLGMAAISKEKLDEVLKTLEGGCNRSEERGIKVGERIKEEADKAKKKINEKVEQTVAKALNGLKFASQEEIAELQKKIDALEKKLDDKVFKA